MTLREIKKGDFFTLKPVENPSDSQVYIKGDYDRATKRFDCVKCSDVWGNGRALKGSQVVYINFTY